MYLSTPYLEQNHIYVCGPKLEIQQRANHKSTIHVSLNIFKAPNKAVVPPRLGWLNTKDDHPFPGLLLPVGGHGFCWHLLIKSIEISKSNPYFECFKPNLDPIWDAKGHIDSYEIIWNPEISPCLDHLLWPTWAPSPAPAAWPQSSCSWFQS